MSTDKLSGVYKITLKKDGRCYIGSSIDIVGRWQNHKYAANSIREEVQVITRAIRKYGKDAFDWEVLEECATSLLIEREQFYLDTLQPFTTNKLGFNIRRTAESNLGIVRSIETRAKQSRTMAGVPKSAEHRRNMSKNWRAKRSDDYFERCSIRFRGDKNPTKNPDVRKKISLAMTGKTWKEDAERVRKHIENRKGKPLSDKAKANMKIAQQKNNTRSAEAKRKFYLAQRRLYKITDPSGICFNMYSRELKIFCQDNKLSYANLITTARTLKPYKGGWTATLLS